MKTTLTKGNLLVLMMVMGLLMGLASVAVAQDTGPDEGSSETESESESETESSDDPSDDASEEDDDDERGPVTGARVFGEDRFGTSVAISRYEFRGGAPEVYLARADNFADAVAAGSLKRGPVLLVPG